MTIKKVATGYKVEVWPTGRNGKRVRKILPTKQEAQRFKTYILTEYAKDKEWNPKQDNRRLRELIELWFNVYGQSTTSGVTWRNRMLMVCDEMSNPLASQFNSDMFADWAEYRLNREVVKQTKDRRKNTPKTVNQMLKIFKAMFNRLKRLGKWDGDMPLADFEKLKEKKPTPGFLSLDEVQTLMSGLKASGNEDLALISEICLSTGARWSEAEKLERSQLFNGVTPLINFVRTKGDEDRLVPICGDLFKRLIKKGEGGRLFKDCYSHFRSVFIRLDIEVPKGQMTHVLRHTFASQFMMNGGNIKVLQKILGHKDIEMTLRYVNFSPEYMSMAATLNPLAIISQKNIANNLNG